MQLEQFAEILANPWVAAYAGLWIVGYLLKNHTRVSNNIIPWALATTGAAMGVALLDLSLSGGIAGAAVGLLAIGVHSMAKHTAQALDE